MRTTRELIVELRAEAATAEFVALAVGFPKETKMVSSTLTDAEALDTLNKLVIEGGHPLGFIRSRCESNSRSIEARPLIEYANDPVPGQVLQQICERMGDELERRYGNGANRLN